MRLHEMIQSLVQMDANNICRRDKEAWLNKIGFHYIGSGSFKMVYSHDDCDYVVKIATSGFDCGMREPENYASAPDHIRPFLLPLLAFGADWQIQRKVCLKASNDRYTHACPICEGHLIDLNGWNHIHEDDGTPVVYDYGQRDQWCTNW